jgi:hypothetical protein
LTLKPAHSDPLRHGLYAHHFTAPQRAALKKMAPDDISYELAAHRVVSAKIFDQIMAVEDDPGALVKLATAWRAVVSAIAVLARTHAILSGKSSELDSMIDEALDGIDFYLTDPD